MKYPPRWLGENYLKLLSRFFYKPFTIEEARLLLKTDDKLARVILSELCKRELIIRLKRGLYLALSPYSIIIKESSWQEKIQQKEYIPLISVIASRLIERYDGRLVSIVIFGSVARGKAKPTSDLDLLVVVENLPERYSERVSQVVELFDDVKEVKLWLWKEKKIFCNIEVLILTPEEAQEFQPLYLDMVEDSIIIYDRTDFFKSVLEKVAEKLRELRAEKVALPGDRWFWRLSSSEEVRS